MSNDVNGDKIYICNGCIGDSFLKSEVRRDGQRRKCNFCEKRRNAMRLEELAERIQNVIEDHFRITPSDPRDEGFAYDKEMDWERRGDPISFVIQGIAELEEEVAEAIQVCLSEKTGWDAHEGGYENPYGFDTFYEEDRPDTYEFRASWDFFQQEIKTRARFFGHFAQNALDDIFGDLANLETWEGSPAVKKLNPADPTRNLYRARIAYSDAEIRKILVDPAKGLGPPPSNLARSGRMNAAGISVFYGAMDPDTCIAEARAPVGSNVVLGCFELVKPIRVLDLDVLTQVVTRLSWFDPEFTTRLTRAAFFRHLVEDIGRPIMPRDEEAEYLPTQVVSEYLASCVEPRLDGIIFHSAQTAGEGRNVVLFHHAAGVEPYNLPDGTNVDVDMGWVSDDDWNDSITVWETVLNPNSKEEKSADNDEDDPMNLPMLESLELFGETEGDNVFDREATLRLDAQNISVFRIMAANYLQTKRSVTRYRRSKDAVAPF